MAAAEPAHVHQPIERLGGARIGGMGGDVGQHLVPGRDRARRQRRLGLVVATLSGDEERALPRRPVGVDIVRQADHRGASRRTRPGRRGRSSRPANRSAAARRPADRWPGSAGRPRPAGSGSPSRPSSPGTAERSCLPAGCSRPGRRGSRGSWPTPGTRRSAWPGQAGRSARRRIRGSSAEAGRRARCRGRRSRRCPAAAPLARSWSGPRRGAGPAVWRPRAKGRSARRGGAVDDRAGVLPEADRPRRPFAVEDARSLVGVRDPAVADAAGRRAIGRGVIVGRAQPAAQARSGRSRRARPRPGPARPAGCCGR